MQGGDENEGSTSDNAIAKRLRRLEEQKGCTLPTPLERLPPRDVEMLEATSATLREQITGLQRRIEELIFKDTVLSTILTTEDDGASRELFDKAVRKARTEWVRRAAEDNDAAVASYGHSVTKPITLVDPGRAKA